MDNKHLEIKRRHAELESLLADHAVVSDSALCAKYARELAELSVLVKLINDIADIEQQIAELSHILSDKTHGHEFLGLAAEELKVLKERMAQTTRRLEDALRPADPDLNRSLMLEIRAGTGGQEAGLFAADLCRMYTKYAGAKGWTAEVMSMNATDLGGVKEVVLSIQGPGAYKHLQFESGVHRVQRVPQTEASGRIHTSAATVAVLFEPEDTEFVVDAKDLKIDVYRAGGHGGQHVNTTDSAVRITHVPTGLVVTCQDERSQIKNRAKAMRVLRTRLMDELSQRKQAEQSQLRKSQVGSGDRSEKIRTYNFPDRRVTDHRIGFTSHRLEAILEGDLDELTLALISASQNPQ